MGAVDRLRGKWTKRIVVALLTALIAAPALAAGDEVSALLLRKTEAFSDAGPLGDGKAMAALVDNQLVFFNENGDRATKADLASITLGPSNGVTTHMAITDWDCRVHGDVAVASFIDNAARTDAGGQTTHARYRSVETWLHQDGDWRMIGSETVALIEDPVAVPVTAIDDYVGTYRAASGLTFTFARSGVDLAATTGGQPLTVQKAEARDIFFTPGGARAIKIFQRDASGKVSGFVYHRAGQAILFTRTI